MAGAESAKKGESNFLTMTINKR